ncbi:phosphatidylinositol glycan anchor biosynthesis class L [Lycorma delicatula]|uniref:phosphatidylinositol glycan anchor biosynthesis class L n=1 Tax=Lycorma delicatula TaxID=130591 RepID=UPI003F5138F4
MTEKLSLYEVIRTCLIFTCEIKDALLKYLRDTFKAFGNLIFIYLIICLLFYLFNAKYAFTNVNKFIKNFRRVLIVTAHPDDECMFFGPFIINVLKNKDCKIFLLCLSNGSFNQEGSKRKEELWDSCEVLGISLSNIFLCRHHNIQDDPNVLWQKEEVAKVVLDYTEKLDIDALVTFDEDGVSGHYNHISIFNAVCFLILKQQLPSYCKVYVLESVNLFRKYTNYMDALLTYLTSNYVCQIKQKEHCIIENAMKKHVSQNVWFRKLYIKFSRYAYINSFRIVDNSNAFLEMDDFM